MDTTRVVVSVLVAIVLRHVVTQVCVCVWLFIIRKGAFTALEHKDHSEERLLSSVGRVVGDGTYRLRIVDRETGERLIEFGQRGEIQMRGDSVMARYYNDPEVCVTVQLCVFVCICL